MTDDEQSDPLYLMDALGKVGSEIAEKCEYHHQPVNTYPFLAGIPILADCQHPDEARRPTHCFGVSFCPKWPK